MYPIIISLMSDNGVVVASAEPRLILTSKLGVIVDPGTEWKLKCNDVVVAYGNAPIEPPQEIELICRELRLEATARAQLVVIGYAVEPQEVRTSGAT